IKRAISASAPSDHAPKLSPMSELRSTADMRIPLRNPESKRDECQGDQQGSAGYRDADQVRQGLEAQLNYVLASLNGHSAEQRVRDQHARPFAVHVRHPAP